MAAATSNTASVYQINGDWFVGVFGLVGVGNGRSVLGYVREVRCFDEACAAAYAARINAASEQSSR